MLTKFETKSKRVKGLSFHPTRPWILASLHTGVIQLWDYRIRTFIDSFDEHDGPVRGVCFHSSQPLFVSGGDDYKIKVWNYKQRKCLFTLLGHLDYIRTVQFHHENPWILSASDDQTIRIWNWQSRSCISILTGHNHYVMSAQFHPTEPRVVSASLDQTVRVWDISGLQKKNFTPIQSDDNLSLPQNDLFGNSDVMVLHVLEGHDRGVNWAAFHPEDSLIVSGADDRQVKFWRMSETKAYEVDTLRGHLSNVSCVLFHPRKPLILSNSEDKTIRVWDLTRRISLKIFRRDTDKDRFWTLVSHPEQNLFAAGHDSGLIVFKLEHERPAYCIDGDVLYYIKERSLLAYNFKQGKTASIMNVRKKSGLDSGPRYLHFNAAERVILVMTNSSYDLYNLPKNASGSNTSSSSQSGKSDSGDSGANEKKGNNVCCFVARNRYAVLDTAARKIFIKNLEQQTTKEIELPKENEGNSLNFDRMWAASTGCVLLRDNQRSIWLFDLQRKKAITKITAANVKFVHWSSNDKDASVALMGRDVLVLANKQLEPLCTVHDTRMKSGAWYNNNIFIYTTLTHVKYCLPNGDTGIIRTLNAPLFIYACDQNKIFCLDRKCATRTLSIDPTEFLLKFAVVNKDYQKILAIVQKFGLLGQSIIAYLQKKGYPELALHFVKDERIRFNLAIECGNIDVALEAAKVVNETQFWDKLGVEALRQGNHQIVEMAYQRTKNFEKLSFLYLITGNFEKLRKMLSIAEKRSDTLGQFHTSLYLADMNAAATVLQKSGQSSLAFAMASTYGLSDLASQLEAQLKENQINPPRLFPHAQLLLPPIPVVPQHSQENWPLLTIQKSAVQQMLSDDKKKASQVQVQVEEEEIGAGWGESIDIDDGEKPAGGDEDELEVPDIGGGEGEGWDVGDLEGLEDVREAPIQASTGGLYIPPRTGPSHSEQWCRNSEIPVDHVAAGSLESAMQLFNSQVGIVNFAPLKPLFLSIFVGSNLSLPTFPGTPSILQGLERQKGYPQLSVSLPVLIERLKLAYKATTGGKFSEAITLFQNIIQSLLFIVVSSRDEEAEAKELLTLAKEYLTGLKTELKRKEVVSSDPTRSTELAAYFTHANLQPIHTMLSLSSAMTCAYKIKNFKSAASFAKRLLELNPQQTLTVQAKKVVAFAEKNSTNAVELNYDERNPFVLCCESYTPIYKGSPSISCPYCKAAYQPKYAGVLCTICELAEVGKQTSGWQVSVKPNQRG